MNRIKIIILIFTLFSINTTNALQDNVIAIVNDNVILSSELNNELARINLDNMNRLESTKLKNEILNKLIEDSLLEQAADRLGIRISDIDLQKQIESIAKNQNLTIIQLKEAVEAQNINYIKYLNKVRKQIQIQELFRTQFTSRAYVSEEEIQSYLKNNHKIRVNNKINVREFLLADESKALDFSKVVIFANNIKKNGLEDTKNRYPDIEIEVTDIKDTYYENLPDIYQNNLKILDQNKYSEIFKTGKGYVLLKILDSALLSEEYKVSHILMKTNPMDNIDTLKEKFYNIKSKAMKDNNFSKYAEQHSLDKASAIKGGSLGWIEKNLVVPEFRRVMVNTKIGDISEPFKTQFGWHILYLEDKRVKNITDDINKRKAISILKERKVEVAKKEWLAKLKDQAYIEIVE